MTRLVILAAVHAALCVAQQRAFEVAAIKPSKADDSGYHSRYHNGRATIDNFTLRQMIVEAYGVRPFQISGGPGWLDTERYHIDAKAEDDLDEKQLLPMVQVLLADRFHLLMHRDKKEMNAYALVQAKGGLKIHAVEGTGSHSTTHNGKMTAKHVSMAQLAQMLSRQLDRPVVDETGAPGGFDFTLEYSNERMQKAAEGGGAAAGPTIFTALPEQLGLRLEARKVAIEMLAIDRAEKPSIDN
jgi:uncharacterized protein (TIGR03435 family)